MTFRLLDPTHPLENMHILSRHELTILNTTSSPYDIFHHMTYFTTWHQDFLVAHMVKCLPIMQETQVRSWVGKIPCRRKWQPTPVFLPGKSHGQRSLVGKELDTAEQLHFTSPSGQYLEYAVNKCILNN